MNTYHKHYSPMMGAKRELTDILVRQYQCDSFTDLDLKDVCLGKDKDTGTHSWLRWLTSQYLVKKNRGSN